MTSPYSPHSCSYDVVCVVSIRPRCSLIEVYDALNPYGVRSEIIIFEFKIIWLEYSVITLTDFKIRNHKGGGEISGFLKILIRLYLTGISNSPETGTNCKQKYQKSVRTQRQMQQL